MTDEEKALIERLGVVARTLEDAGCPAHARDVRKAAALLRTALQERGEAREEAANLRNELEHMEREKLTDDMDAESDHRLITDLRARLAAAQGALERIANRRSHVFSYGTMSAQEAFDIATDALTRIALAAPAATESPFDKAKWTPDCDKCEQPGVSEGCCRLAAPAAPEKSE